MVQQLKIGGKVRPISFGWEVAYDYEFHTGKHYIDTVMSIIEEVTAVASASGEEDVLAAARHISVVKITDIVYYGLLHAHKHQRVEFPYSVYDVAEWLFTDHEVRGQCLLAISESMPKATPDGESADTKKKPGSRPGSTGKGLSKRLQQSG